MASSSVTLYKVDGVTAEVFTLDSVLGKDTKYTGASSTPTFPIMLTLTKDAKSVGMLANDRMAASVKRSAAATAQSKVVTGSATLSCSIGKDPTSGSALLTEAESALTELISYFTGTAPTATTITNVSKFVAGVLL